MGILPVASLLALMAMLAGERSMPVEAMARSTPGLAERIAYGAGPSQFGELWLPAGSGPVPVAILVHGGCWQSSYGLDLMDPMGEDLQRQGIAVWNIEYRRLGESGRGHPGALLPVRPGRGRLRDLSQPA